MAISDFINDDVFIGWSSLNECKYAYACGERSLDRDWFAETVKKTFYGIKEFNTHLFGDKSWTKRFRDLEEEPYSEMTMPITAERNVTPKEILDYFSLLADLKTYSVHIAKDNKREVIDQSDDRLFSASQVITRLLLRYAYYYNQIFTPVEENGVLYGDSGDCKILTAAGEADDDEEFWDRTFKYDVNTGDMSEILELVNKPKHIYFYY